jgi:carotenoid cleavage dioxygenase-like enzyme
MRGHRPYAHDERMATRIRPPLSPSDDCDVDNAVAGLTIVGGFPIGLSGRLLGIGPDANGDGVIHCIDVRAGGSVSYRRSWVNTDAVAQRVGIDRSPGPRNDGPDTIADSIILFGGSILAFGHGSLAYELTPSLDTVRRVDLAGQTRGLTGFPKIDAATGDLHLLTVPAAGAQVHVVVSAAAHMRTTRSIGAAPLPVNDLAITADRIVFAANGFVGVTSRAREATITWLPTGADTVRLVRAHDVGDTVVVLALTPSLERWTLAPASSPAVTREVLDPTPQHFVTTAGLVDGGWLIGFANDAASDRTDVVVRDAADITLAAVATGRISGRIPRNLHGVWMPHPQTVDDEGASAPTD